MSFVLFDDAEKILKTNLVCARKKSLLQQPINNKDDTINPKTATTTSAVVDTQFILTDDGILKNTNQKQPVLSVFDESFTTEDAIRDEGLVGRILSRKTAKKKRTATTTIITG